MEKQSVMSVTELKLMLRQAVEEIDDEETLERMLNAANGEQAGLTKEQIEDLKERERKLASGEAKLVPWEEVDAKIRAKHGF